MFDGHGYVRIPDDDDFSVTTTGGLTVVALLTITDWHGVGNDQYVHWLGKGLREQHEWVFRHYVQGGSGEAATRQGRTSFYYFNPDGGLGAGSYFQDAMDTTERLIIGTADLKRTAIWKNGVKRDSDPLSGYHIDPRNTAGDVYVGFVGDDAGALVGRVRDLAFFDHVLTDAQIEAISRAWSQLVVESPGSTATH